MASSTARAGKGAEYRMSGYNEIGAMNFAEGFLLAGGQADFISNKLPSKQVAQDRAALGAVLCFARDGRGAVVRQAKDIIGTGMVEAGKLDQYLGGDIPLAGLVIGIADLCTFQIRRNILLQ